MGTKKFYRGFSTRDYEANGGNFAVYNIKCIEADLLNEIFTVKGERINMPSFGTNIPLLVFELGDSNTYDALKTDLVRVFNNEPRIQLLQLDIVPVTDYHALVAIANIKYLEFNVVQDLRIEVNSR